MAKIRGNLRQMYDFDLVSQFDDIVDAMATFLLKLLLLLLLFQWYKNTYVCYIFYILIY